MTKSVGRAGGAGAPPRGGARRGDLQAQRVGGGVLGVEIDQLQSGGVEVAGEAFPVQRIGFQHR
ncbi:hypothetical protein, partial [Nocardia flavorosea]|uniref:hypothetical protein n=1 Tax=Nocardia flavorosea TaxID=53429 RepID=UPI002455DC22